MHTSDLHLHPSYPERLRALKTVCQSATEFSCQAVVIAGDLFDNEPSAHQMRAEVRSLFEEFPNLKIYVISGNHDANAYNDQQDYGQNVSIISNKPFQEISPFGDEARLIAIPYRAGRIGAILSQIPPPNGMPTVFIAHGSFFHQQWAYAYWKLKDSEEGNSCAIFPVDLEGRKFSYVALGHWHQPTDPAIKCETTKIAYSGTPYPISKDEVGRRKAAVVELDLPEQTSVKFIDLPAIPYYVRKKYFVVMGGETTLLDKIQRYLQEKSDQYAMLMIEVEGYLEESETDFRNKLEEIKNAKQDKWKEVEIKFNAVQFPLNSRPAIDQFLKLMRDEVKLNLDMIGLFSESELKSLADEILSEEVNDLRYQSIRYGLQAFQWVLG